MTNQEIINIAKIHQWEHIATQENIGMLSFFKDGVRINVYTTKMTIATCLNHPKSGKTQLFRRNVWKKNELEKIFLNPRVHTGKGYFNKN